MSNVMREDKESKASSERETRKKGKKRRIL